jgi:hypothetical protein
MDKEDKVKKVLFRYLDELFKNITVEEMKFPKFTFSLIDTSEIKGIVGKVGDSRIFWYFPETNTISFNTNELITIIRMFGFGAQEALEYVKTYIINNVDGIPADANIYSTSKF